MIIRILAAAAVLVAGLGFAPVANAQSQDPYTVTDINVDLTRETSATARQEAIQQAHIQGLRHLLERLTPASEHGRIPDIGYGTAADLADGLRIQDEKTTATRYAANMTISFRKDRVRSYLRQRGLEVVEQRAPAVVVAPVYRWAGAQALWEQNNPWRDAWTFRGRSDGLAPVLLPEADLADASALSAAQASGRDRARLSAFAARYGAAGVLVTEAAFQVDPVSGRPTLDVTADVVGGGPPLTGYRNKEVGEPGARPEDLGVAAANKLVAALEASWKRGAAGPPPASLSSLVADLPISNIREYADAQRRLDQSPGLERHEIVALSRQRARIRLFYRGSAEDLRAGVARQSMDLAPAGPGGETQWVLIAPPTYSAQ